MALHKFTSSDYQILSPFMGIATRFPDGTVRVASSLIDHVVVENDKFVVSITGGDPRTGYSVSFRVTLFADKDLWTGYPEDFRRKEAEMLFAAPMPEQDFLKLITLGNQIMEEANGSSDLYVVYMQVVRKYSMEILREG